jgi:hypothetical protein
MLQMLEAARDNLVTLGERMDRLHDTSRQCRMALLLQQQEQQEQHEQHEQQQFSQAEHMGTLSTATDDIILITTNPQGGLIGFDIQRPKQRLCCWLSAKSLFIDMTKTVEQGTN